MAMIIPRIDVLNQLDESGAMQTVTWGRS